MISDEGFKAFNQALKTGEKLLEIAESVGAYVEQTFGPGVKQLGIAFEDSMQQFRLRNLASAIAKTKRHLASLSADTNYRAIDERQIFPLIDAISMESNDTLQEYWAIFLANSLNPNKENVGITRVIIDVIKNLEPADKEIIDAIFCLDLKSTDIQRVSPEEMKISDEAANFSLTRFVSMGLFDCDTVSNQSYILVSSNPNRYPGCLKIYTSIGCFTSRPLLYMLKDAIENNA